MRMTRIILIFMGIISFGLVAGYAFINYLQHKGHMLASKASIKGLEVGTNGFRTEYKRLPSALQSIASETTPIRSEGALIKCLMADDPADNPRRIRFYQPPISKSGLPGLVVDSATVKVADSWGEAHYILADADGDGQISNPEPSPVKAPFKIPAAVIIYSSGPDKDPTTWKDNIKSWD